MPRFIAKEKELARVMTELPTGRLLVGDDPGLDRDIPTASSVEGGRG